LSRQETKEVDADADGVLIEEAFGSVARWLLTLSSGSWCGGEELNLHVLADTSS
jgi:hypothetical protein